MSWTNDFTPIGKWLLQELGQERVIVNCLLDKQATADDRWHEKFSQERVMASQKYYRDFREHLKALEERGELLQTS